MSISVAKWTFFLSLCVSRINSFFLLTFSRSHAGIVSSFFASGPNETRDFCATFSSSGAAQYPGSRKAHRSCNKICGTSFSSTVAS